MDRVITDNIGSAWWSKSVILLLSALLLMVMSINSAHSAWFQRLLPKDDAYIVKDVEGDEVFVINNFIYDARQTCNLTVGDKVIFADSEYGVDYRATIYNLNSATYCELLLRDPVS
ncbi:MULTISPECIES: hypothetical protein [Psychrobacter]|uniref:hypothetical protein n=1 Tax=Psychrobacter TaxID=497 RepID=UPI00191822FE|nr:MULTISPECIES: hypothetical protein [Psychrobacter]